MREQKSDLWLTRADAKCITTNGFTHNGVAAMGGGCAREAAILYPDLPHILGDHIDRIGNHVNILKYDGVTFLLSYPTIPTVADDVDTRQLVMRSAEELVSITNVFKWDQVLIPRPGCGIGGLNWNEIKTELAQILDDRFLIVSYRDQD